MYSLIVTAKLNDVDPRAWLADVLARIADHPVSQLAEGTRTRRGGVTVQGRYGAGRMLTVQRRARLLLPADAPAQQEAAVEADALRGQLVAFEDMQALAGRLARRPQRGIIPKVRPLRAAPPKRAPHWRDVKPSVPITTRPPGGRAK
jgi:hypothetical protein